LLQGCGVDLPLSAEGRWQAERTAELFRDIPLDAVFASTLKRSRETAEAIAAKQALSVELVDALREADVGRWERRSWIEIAETEPEAHRRFLEDPARHGYSGGENLQQVFDRVRPAMEALLQQHVGHRIAVVGHNVVNRVFLSTPLGISLQQARTIHLDNCGVSVLRFQSGHLRLLTLNAATHLYSPSGESV